MSRSVIIFCISGNFLVVSPFTLSVEILMLCCLWVRRSAYSVEVGVSICERLVLSLCIGSVSEGKASRYSSVVRVDGSGGGEMICVLFGPSVSIVKGIRFVSASLCLIVLALRFCGVVCVGCVEDLF
jgi:hypothetical protein